MSDYNCQIINTREHTFHRTYNNYSNLLDLIICSPLTASVLSEYKVLSELDATSDHFPVLACFELERPSHTESTKNSNQIDKRYDYKRADWDKYRSILENTNLNYDEFSNTETLEKEINRAIIDAANSAIPTFKYKANNTALPKHILDLIKERRLVRARDRKNKLNGKKYGLHIISKFKELADIEEKSR